ncbi:MAG: glycosyltransferase family 4 protein [Candidatus Eremiobacterota bacterium]
MNIKVALIIPWFGKDLKGGAEQQAWQIAMRLSKRELDVTVLTTCSQSFSADWSVNYYEPGEYREENFIIKRFPVIKRNSRIFDKIVSKLLSLNKENLLPSISPVNRAEEEIYLSENINSPSLITYLHDNCNFYDIFLFMPYLFPVTIKGIKAVKDRAILQPCLHDECYAYLEKVGQAFYDAKKIFYNSAGEYEVARILYGNSIAQKSVITGEGVEIENNQECNEMPLIKGNYILYIGKKDRCKNTDFLIKVFDNFVERTGSKMKLLLAGTGSLPPGHRTGQIIDMGIVSEKEKINLLTYCKALINPSINESFSRVVFEAWFFKKPVIVHRACLATYKALESSGFAGIAGDTDESFIEIFTYIDNSDEKLIQEMGNRGYDYADRTSRWDRVIDTYISEFQSLIKENNKKISSPSEINKDIKIIFMYRCIAEGDAVGNDIIKEYDTLKKHGYSVYLYAEEGISSLSYITDNELLEMKEKDLIIYHHANYWEKGEELIKKFKGKVFMRYHNITPHTFFEPYSKTLTNSTKKGREQTEKLIKEGIFFHYIATGEYNLKELVSYGVRTENISLLAPFHRINDFNKGLINSELLDELSHNRINLLFTGRISPNKGHKHLIKTVKEYVNLYDRKIHLNIIGGSDCETEGYYKELRDIIDAYNLSDIITFRNTVSFEDLNTFYRGSDIFLLMSEHEGFCVPVLEAQYHRLPVIALEKSAVKNTVGNNQITFKNPDYRLFASAIHTVSQNKLFRYYLTDQGYTNYLKYEESVLNEQLLKIIMEHING